jgi:hypothetical protein
MKKIVFFLSFVTILSCSSSDDNSNSNSSGANYHPPAWIQGTWGYKASQDMNEEAVYKFETDNLCQLAGVTSICWKESANQYKNSSAPNVVAEDMATSSTYEAKFGQGGTIITLKFQKISATQIKWVNTGSGMDIILDKLK